MDERWMRSRQQRKKVNIRKNSHKCGESNEKWMRRSEVESSEEKKVM